MAAPVANSDSYTTAINSPLTVLPSIVNGSAPWDVLQNDTGPAGATLSVLWYSTAQHGSVAVGTDGSFLYTPECRLRGQRQL